jgi:hypothetical protein
MPCRDYESDNGYSRAEEYKKQCDKLARIACAAMEELVRQGKEDFLVLKNPEVAEWWVAHVKADRAEKARVAEKERQERVKAEALSRLTDEEKELLGLKKSAAKKHKKFPLSKELVEIDYDIESFKEELDEYQKISEADIENLHNLLRKHNI